MPLFRTVQDDLNDLHIENTKLRQKIKLDTVKTVFFGTGFAIGVLGTLYVLNRVPQNTHHHKQD